MRVWTVKFNGHHPVGACAVVVAETAKDAFDLTWDDLEKRGLRQRLTLGMFTEVDLDTAQSIVLLDGDY